MGLSIPPPTHTHTSYTPRLCCEPVSRSWATDLIHLSLLEIKISGKLFTPDLQALRLQVLGNSFCCCCFFFFLAVKLFSVCDLWKWQESTHFLCEVWTKSTEWTPEVKVILLIWRDGSGGGCMEKTSYTEPHLAVIFTCTVALVGLRVSSCFIVTRLAMLLWSAKGRL